MVEFVEGLVAEAFTGPTIPFVDEGGLRARPGAAAREEAFERETKRWAFLRAHTPDDEIAEAARTLEKTARLCREAEARSESADSLIRGLLRVEDEIERSLGPLLARMGEIGAWRGLRYSGVGHYAEERLGISRTQAEDRARLARDLRSRPRLRCALEEGRFGWEAAALIARALRPSHVAEQVESAWIERAAEATIKRLRDEVRIADRERVMRDDGDREGDHEDGREGDHEDGREGDHEGGGDGDHESDREGDRDGGVAAPLSDAQWQASRSRRLGQSIERIARLAAVACARPTAGTVIRFRLPVDLAAQLLSAVSSERARLERICREADTDSAISSGGRRPGGIDSPFSGSGPGSVAEWGTRGCHVLPPLGGVGRAADMGTVREAGREGEAGGTADPLTPGSVLAARMVSTRLGFVPDWVALLALIEHAVATWDDPRQAPRRAGDRIYIRDGWRCSAPGCTSRRNLEQHHITYRSKGGLDRPWNLVTLCRFHHQQGEHNGLLKCRGRAPLGIFWWMGDRSRGGRFRNERRLGVNANWDVSAACESRECMSHQG